MKNGIYKSIVGEINITVNILRFPVWW